MPPDVLSEKDLSGMNIHIIQADNVQFFIRKGAFEKGGSLEQFKDGKTPILIVLVDGNVLSSIFMKDSRYDSIRYQFADQNQNVNSYRKGEIAKYQRKIAECQRSFNNQIAKYKALNETPNPNESEFKNYQDNILNNKLEMYQYENRSDEDLAFEMARNETDQTGLYTKGFPYTIDGKTYNTAIFICVGGSNPNTEEDIFYYTGEGSKLQVQRHASNRSFLDLTPDPRQTHPNPADFSPNQNSDKYKYPYYSTTSGRAWHHEKGHLIWREQHPNDEIPADIEYKATMGAIEEMTEAWDKWYKSRYTDGSGYNFVFSIPKSRGGGYILTFENIKTTQPLNLL